MFFIRLNISAKSNRIVEVFYKNTLSSIINIILDDFSSTKRSIDNSVDLRCLLHHL